MLNCWIRTVAVLNQNLTNTFKISFFGRVKLIENNGTNLAQDENLTFGLKLCCTQRQSQGTKDRTEGEEGRLRLKQFFGFWFFHLWQNLISHFLSVDLNPFIIREKWNINWFKYCFQSFWKVIRIFLQFVSPVRPSSDRVLRLKWPEWTSGLGECRPVKQIWKYF